MEEYSREKSKVRFNNIVSGGGQLLLQDSDFQVLLDLHRVVAGGILGGLPLLHVFLDSLRLVLLLLFLQS